MKIIVSLFFVKTTLFFVKIMLSTAKVRTRPRGSKTFFMLNSTEHEIDPAHKC